MALHLRKMVTYCLAGWLPGGGKRCAVCGNRVWRFMPYRRGRRDVPHLIRVLDIVGSDVDHFECPRCGAHDRERHLLLFLKASSLFENLAGASILHFAPEKRLSRIIAEQRPGLHVRCDLYPTASDMQRVDIQCMPFGDNSIDLLLANHVLEHVDAPDMALAEIYRVLKPGGHAILQTPYSQKLRSTWEDAGIDTPQARLQAYGQEDHMRLFGRDIFDRYAKSGLLPLVQTHQELLPSCDSILHGVNEFEPFFLFRKDG